MSLNLSMIYVTFDILPRTLYVNVLIKDLGIWFDKKLKFVYYILPVDHLRHKY